MGATPDPRRRARTIVSVAAALVTVSLEVRRRRRRAGLLLRLFVSSSQQQLLGGVDHRREDGLTTLDRVEADRCTAGVTILVELEGTHRAVAERGLEQVRRRRRTRAVGVRNRLQQRESCRRAVV